jgi:hypothetical protein
LGVSHYRVESVYNKMLIFSIMFLSPLFQPPSMSLLVYS